MRRWYSRALVAGLVFLATLLGPLAWLLLQLGAQALLGYGLYLSPRTLPVFLVVCAFAPWSSAAGSSGERAMAGVGSYGEPWF